MSNEFDYSTGGQPQQQQLHQLQQLQQQQQQLQKQQLQQGYQSEQTTTNGTTPPAASGRNGNNNNKESPPKTPVSLLQEALSRRGITPAYELVQIEGAIHEPTFRYRVSFNDKDAMGAGKSKKEAKHAAARALIEKLADIQVYMPASMKGDHVANATPAEPDSDNGDSSMATANGDGGDQIGGNPIGWLQEQCMLRRWPPPTYETEMEVGLPHERQFTIACVVLKLREVAQGKSKKIAKRSAAKKMWLRLVESFPMDGADDAANAAAMLDDMANMTAEEMAAAGGGGGSGRGAGGRSRYADLKDAAMPVLTNQNSFKVAQFHRAMKSSRGQRIAMLQQQCLAEAHLNYVQLLHEIAVEHQFEVTYVDIEERTYAGLHQCFVQLSTMPVAVITGQGATYQEAQMDAAHNSLQYLKIMTKK